MDELNKLQSIIKDLEDNISICLLHIDKLDSRINDAEYTINDTNKSLDYFAERMGEIDGSIDVCTSRLNTIESDITDVQKQVDMHNTIMISVNLSISKLASSIEYIENRLNELAGYKKIMFT